LLEDARPSGLPKPGRVEPETLDDFAVKDAIPGANLLVLATDFAMVAVG
jgi:hypothetical protein